MQGGLKDQLVQSAQRTTQKMSTNKSDSTKANLSLIMAGLKSSLLL